MGKRIVGVFFVYIVAMLCLTGWLLRVTFAQDYVEAGSRQSSYTLTVARSRGKIYDRELNVLAGGAYSYRAAVEPSPEAAAKLIGMTGETETVDLEEKLKSSRPFLLDVRDGSLRGEGINVFRIQKRYGEAESIAPHVVGYLNGEGHGVSGVERAYDETLEDFSGELKIRYTVDAVGSSLETEPVVTDTTHDSDAGVVLTLSSGIQLAVQHTLERNKCPGAVVVMDPYNGDILALASYPSFRRDDIASCLDAQDSPLLNKSLADYDVGSVFKLVVAAAALENGMGDFACECEGFVDVGGKRFHCSSKKGHGHTDMERAIACSCNKYFILLGKELGKEKLIKKAREMGFGRRIQLAENYFTSKGNLPDDDELSLPAGLANFSFGQGSLMANPVQLAAAVSCVANGGEYVTPKIVKGICDRSKTITKEWNGHAPYRVMSERTAEKIKDCMKSTMIYGTGRSLSLQYRAAGKTGTAQTGMVKNGKKVTQGWFAGFFPIDEPKYVCVILAENAGSGAQNAGPVFAGIVRNIMGQ